MPGMRTIRQTIVVLVSMPGFFVWPVALANDEAEHHETSKHELALFVGGGVEREHGGHEESGAAIGIKYDLEFSEKWGASVDLEYLSGSGTHRSWVVAVPVSYHPNEKWRVFAGPGKEFGGEKDNYLLRAGLAYQIPLSQRWSIYPEFVVDFSEGGAKTYVLGMSIGYGF